MVYQKIRAIVRGRVRLRLLPEEGGGGGGFFFGGGGGGGGGGFFWLLSSAATILVGLAFAMAEGALRIRELNGRLVAVGFGGGESASRCARTSGRPHIADVSFLSAHFLNR